MTRVELVLRDLGIKHEIQGARAWALCPWHEDEHPSWSIMIRGQRAGLSHCFACKRGGDLTALVRRVKSCDRDEADDWLDDVGKRHEPTVVTPRFVERPARIGRRRFRMPPEFARAPLVEWPTPARRYAERRGITAAQVLVFGLGYAVEGRLEGRIVIPFRPGIIDGRPSEPTSYSARSFTGEEPRYLTPHAREGADPGAVFGEHAWMGSNTLVLSEGAIDALAVWRAVDHRWPGVCVGALGGSQIAPEQAMTIATFPRIVAMTDPDHAGDAAALSLAAMLGRHVRVDRARLPEGLDAAKMTTDALAEFLARFL